MGIFKTYLNEIKFLQGSPGVGRNTLFLSSPRL